MPRKRSRPAAPRQQRVPTRYNLWEDSVDLNALAADGTLMGEIIDRTVLSANPIRVTKCTTQIWMEEMDNIRPILMAIVRQTQGGSIPDIRDKDVVIDLRNENKLLRGPWVRGTMNESQSQRWNDLVFTKTIVLKNLTLDANDDVEVIFLNLSGTAFAGTAQRIHWMSRIFWREV